MNNQPNRNSNPVQTSNCTAAYLSTNESSMNRRIATFLFALFAAMILSACAIPYPFQGTGSVTVLPKEAVTDLQINSRQDLAQYQATFPAISLVATAPKTVKANGPQISNRQQLAEYQASLPLYVALPSAKSATSSDDTQNSGRQWLADYQVTLR